MVGSSGFSSMARSRFFTASSIIADAVIGPAERDPRCSRHPGAARRRGGLHLHAVVETDALIDRRNSRR